MDGLAGGSVLGVGLGIHLNTHVRQMTEDEIQINFETFRTWGRLPGRRAMKLRSKRKAQPRNFHSSA